MFVHVERLVLTERFGGVAGEQHARKQLVHAGSPGALLRCSSGSPASCSSNTLYTRFMPSSFSNPASCSSTRSHGSCVRSFSNPASCSSNTLLHTVHAVRSFSTQRPVPPTRSLHTVHAVRSFSNPASCSSNTLTTHGSCVRSFSTQRPVPPTRSYTRFMPSEVSLAQRPVPPTRSLHTVHAVRSFSNPASCSSNTLATHGSCRQKFL
ncbi:hypothetical protein KUCAC02_009531 [Chaenocephalus aceratus]|nr:hypothetical protein KUCAC02_009531 [Chaenocephalus aceratus]